jgi:hypothetical protein
MNWLIIDSKYCNIKYIYIDSNNDEMPSNLVRFKQITTECNFYFNLNKDLTVIYVYINLFNQFEKKDESVIGHHITIMHFSKNNKNYFGFHSTIYNPKNINQAQYRWFYIDIHLNLVNITDTGDIGFASPDPFLLNLWNHIKCGIAQSQVVIPKPSFASLFKNKVGGFTKIIKIKNNNKSVSQILKLIKKEKYDNIQIFKYNNNILLIIRK